MQHDRTKHVEIDRHFIKENISSGTLCVPFVKSCVQIADVLTKAIGSRPFHTILDKLGMRDIFVPALGGVLRIICNGCYFYFIITLRSSWI